MTISTLRQKNLQDNLKHKTFVPGELMALEADYYWMIEEGVVKTYTQTEEGTPITLGYWGVNDLIGQSLSLIYPYQVKCLTTVKARRVPLKQADQITGLIQRHLQQMEEVLYILRSDKIYQRLKGILVWLGNKFGQAIEIGQLIDLRLTHQDLAELVGATRVTITKLINQLEQEGFLSRPGRNTFIICKQH
jgi:CRP-like cAMP-binding protein